MNLFRGIPGLLRPTNEQTSGPEKSGGLLASQAPGVGGAAGGSSGGSGFLSYLQSHQPGDVASAGARPESPADRQSPTDPYLSRPERDREDYARQSREAERANHADRSRDERAADARQPERKQDDPNNPDYYKDRTRSDSANKAEDAARDARADRAAKDNANEHTDEAAADSKARTKAEEQGEAGTKGENADSSTEKKARKADGNQQQKLSESLAKDGVAAGATKAGEAGANEALDSAVAELSANLKDVLLTNKDGTKQSGGAELKAGGGVAGKGAETSPEQIGLARDGAKAAGPAADATELSRFAERVSAAQAKLRGEEAGQKASKQGSQNGENQSGNQSGNKEAKIDAASGGLRVELDSAKWQLNGRVYGERAGNENVESRVAGMMDRHVGKTRGANSKDSGGNSKDSGGESGRDQRGDTRSFANRLSDLQIMNGGEARDANSQSALDQARMQRENQEIARENRRLINDLVEKARVNVQSNGSSTASIKMNPAALGRMTLNLEVHQNQVHARILVDSDAAKRMLMDEMDHLRQELTRQGITVESLSIKVREPASMSFMEGSNSGEQSGLEQQNAGEDATGEGAAHDGRADGEDQGLRAADQAGQEYDLAAGAPANAEAGGRRELSAVNISI